MRPSESVWGDESDGKAFDSSVSFDRRRAKLRSRLPLPERGRNVRETERVTAKGCRRSIDPSIGSDARRESRAAIGRGSP